MSIALRLFLSFAFIATALIVLLGPRWRGDFYRTWLRPRLVAFGVLLVVFTTGLYLFRVFNAIQNR